jgi:hypothetical protein
VETGRTDRLRRYSGGKRGAVVSVLKVIGVLVVLWIVLGIVGLIIKGLFVLFVIACVALGFTLASSAARRGLLRR